MELPTPSFERTVLLLVLIFCGATYARLLPLGVGKDEVQIIMQQLNNAFQNYDARLKKLEPEVEPAKK